MKTLEEKSKRFTEYIGQLTQLFLFIKAEPFPPEYECTTREIHVLLFLGWRGTCNMTEIADHLRLPVSTVTGIVDRLVQKKLVNRSRTEEDRRVVMVELSENGKKFKNWQLKEHRKVSRAILESLREADQDILLDLMSKIVQRLQVNTTSGHELIA